MITTSLSLALYSTLALQPAQSAQATVSPAAAQPETQAAPSASAAEVSIPAPQASPAVVEISAAEPAPETAAEPEAVVVAPQAAEPEPAPVEPVVDSDEPDPTSVNAEKSHYKEGSGLSFESADKANKMQIRLRVQFRDEVSAKESTTTNDDGSTSKDTAVSNTFGIRRARLQFQGNMWGKNNKYKAEFAFSPSDLGMKDGVPHNTPLLSWYVEFTQMRDLSLRMGQYKLLYSRQRVISSGNLELVDRSLAQNEFNLDRDVGLHFFSKDLFGLDKLRYYAGVSVGEGRDVYSTSSFKGTDAGGLQYLARLEFLPAGDSAGKWDYSEADFARAKKPQFSIALAYAFLDDGKKDRGYQGSAFKDADGNAAGTVDYHNAAADVLMHWSGLSAFGEFFWRKGERQGAPAGDTSKARSGVGYTAQLGYMLPQKPLNIAARFSAVRSGPYKEVDTAISSKNEVGAGTGYYFAGHSLKLQADYFHTWGDKFSENATDMFRVQLQVAY